MEKWGYREETNCLSKSSICEARGKKKKKRMQLCNIFSFKTVYFLKWEAKFWLHWTYPAGVPTTAMFHPYPLCEWDTSPVYSALSTLKKGWGALYLRPDPIKCIIIYLVLAEGQLFKLDSVLIFCGYLFMKHLKRLNRRALLEQGNVLF